MDFDVNTASAVRRYITMAETELHEACVRAFTIPYTIEYDHGTALDRIKAHICVDDERQDRSEEEQQKQLASFGQAIAKSDWKVSESDINLFDEGQNFILTLTVVFMRDFA